MVEVGAQAGEEAFSPTRRPLISVVAPVYNPGAELGAALENIASLTYPDLEIIIVDDASPRPCDTWGHSELLREGDRRAVTWMRLAENVGPAGARNAGLGAASGEFVWFVDWDDEWDPSILDRLMDEIEATGADFAMCKGQWWIDGHGGPATDGHDSRLVMDGESAFMQLLMGGIRGYLWTKVFRRGVLGDAPFEPHGYIEDFFVVADVVARSEVVVSIPETLYRHVVREGSLSNSKDPELHHLEEAAAHVRELAGGLSDTPGIERGLAHFELEYNHIARAMTAIRLCTAPRMREVLREVRRQILVADVLRVATVAPGTATRAALIKVAGPYYPEVRNVTRAAARQVAKARGSVARVSRGLTSGGAPASA